MRVAKGDNAASRAGVSGDPSLTTMTSRALKVCENTESSAPTTSPGAQQTGTITDTSGAASMTDSTPRRLPPRRPRDFGRQISDYTDVMKASRERHFRRVDQRHVLHPDATVRLRRLRLAEPGHSDRPHANPPVQGTVMRQPPP